MWHTGSVLSCLDAVLDRHLAMHVQIEMWERITAGLASLGDQAGAGNSRESAPSEQFMDEQQLVEYEGMLVAASAAQRRRCLIHPDCPNAKSYDSLASINEGGAGGCRRIHGRLHVESVEGQSGGCCIFNRFT